MSKKKSQTTGGIVYSTDPAFRASASEQSAQSDVPPAHQQLRIVLDTRHRAGKAVTLIYGFEGVSASLEDLGKQLKAACGTGGSVKEGDIIIQGDHREKVKQWLHKKGFTAARIL